MFYHFLLDFYTDGGKAGNTLARKPTANSEQIRKRQHESVDGHQEVTIPQTVKFKAQENEPPKKRGRKPKQVADENEEDLRYTQSDGTTVYVPKCGKHDRDAKPNNGHSDGIDTRTHVSSRFTMSPRANAGLINEQRRTDGSNNADDTYIPNNGNHK